MSMIVKESNRPNIRFLNRYGLDLASERNGLTVLSDSCIAHGYMTDIKRLLPFSNPAVAAIVTGEHSRFLLNEEYVASRIGRVLRRLGSRKFVTDILRPTHHLGRQALRTIGVLRPKVHQHPETTLRGVLDAYRLFLAAIGTYNCLNRYAARVTLPWPATIVKRIARQRDFLGSQYPDIERLVARCAILIGRRRGFDGRLLRHMTYEEVCRFLTTQRLSRDELHTLRRRRRLCLFIQTPGRSKGQVTTDRRFIRSLEKRLESTHSPLKELHGQTAYPGFVRGVVFRSTGRRRPNTSSIFITSMTHPKDTPLIKACAAIVTNEGGILSHAAVLAREFHIPCVIGTKIATQVLKDGDRVEVDATKGIVRKV